MSYSIFTAAGLKAPYCKQVCDLSTYAPEGTKSDHPGLGTLTFRRGPNAPPNPAPAKTSDSN